MAQKGEEIKRFARKNNDRELELEVDFFLTYRNTFFQNMTADEAIRRLKALIEISDREHIWHIKIRTIRILAEYYWKYVADYQLAFEQYLLLDRELKGIKPEDFPEMARDLLQIGESYYFFHDYKLAKKYLKRALALPETDFNSILLNTARNTLGLCYQHEKQYDSSDYYFNEVLKTKFARPRQIWERIVKGNIGANHYYRKEYDKAIPLLVYDLEGAVKANDFGPAAGASILLADIYLLQGDAKKSWGYLISARENIEKIKQYDRLQYLYPVISKWYNLSGNRKLSQMYLDSTVMAINSYHEKFNAMKVLRAQQKITMQEEELRLAEFTLEKQRKTNERNAVTIVAVALCIIIVLGYFVQKKRQQAQKLEILATQKELEIAALNLNKFTESIAEKNKLIEQLQNHRSDEDKSALIAQLQHSSILTEDDWQLFQRLFDKAYPGFIPRAKLAYPDLSVSELRYFVLSKLKISYREMAAMLGVSPNTVQVLRHRMRKKLNFSDNMVMEDVITSI